MQAADDGMMQTLEREYGPLGDYQEAVVQQEDTHRAAWLPTDGAAGAAAGDASTALGAVEATGEAAGTASVNGAAQTAQVAGVQAAAPAASGLAVTPGAFAFSPMALAGGAAALGVLTATASRGEGPISQANRHANELSQNLRPSPAPQPAPEPAPQPAPQPAPAPEPSPAPAPQPAPEPAPQPAPEPPPAPAPRPVAPSYDDAPVTRAARHNETVELRASTFSGKDAEHAPSYVRIEGIEAKGARAGSAALQLRADDGSLTPVAENQEIAAADFSRLVWNSADNDGGSFRFVPLDSKRQPYDGVQPQTVNIYESPAVPDYASARDPLAVAHDQTLTLGQELFAGNAADKAPAFIRIEKITPQGDTGAGAALQRDADGDGPGAPTAVSEGDVISAADFGKLSWNTAHNNGGSFRFVALDANQKPILGASAQTITVSESPAAPDYPAARDPLSVAHDQTLPLGQDLFAGNTANKAPSFIRIESIDAKNGDGTGIALQRDADGDGPGAPTAVSEGDVISAADFGKLSWNTAHNNGGSFRFVPLDANQKPILGTTVQTVAVLESLPVPDYPAEPVVHHLSHEQTIIFPNSDFSGTNQGHAPAAIRIEDITLNNYDGSSPSLLLEGRGKSGPTPISVGQTITAENFGKLIWMSVGNEGGSFRFVALDDNGKPFDGVQPQTISVYESPDAPDYPSVRNPLTVAHDQTLALNQELFAGKTPSKAPAFIRIESIDAKDGDGTGAALQRDADGGPPTAVKEGDVISAADFGKLSWNSAHNNGGSFRFVALDSNQKPNLTTIAQTITVSESPAAPDYPAAREPLAVAHDQTLTLGQELFAGNTANKAPSFIRIDKITPQGDNGAGAALQRDADGDGPGAPTAVSEGEIISAADFGKLSWNSAHNDGGSFRFVPLDANQKPILGASAQTITVSESPAAPDYPAAREPLSVAHDQTLTLGQALFAGNAADKAPSFIRIENITPQGDTGAGAALQRDADGDGPGAPTAVSEGDIISAADFGKLSWNTAHNEGGSFRFVPLDANQKPILGASAQTITVSESPAAPDYPTAREPLAVAHDQTLALGQELFTGNTTNKAPAFIRIESITPKDGDGTGAALQRDADGDGPGAPTAVSEGDVISAADFGKLSWNSAHNDGGSFRFVALDANRKPILGAPEQTITVHESPTAPVYPADPVIRAVAHEQTATFPESTFAGTNQDYKPAAIRIEAINPSSHDGASPSLQLLGDGTPTPVTVGQTITADNFGKLTWNTVGNEGGSFRFAPLDGTGQPYVGVQPQTVSVYESPAAPEYPNARSSLAVAHDQTLPFEQELFVGGASSKAPAFIRIEKITAKDDDGTGTALQRDDDGAGPAAPTAVQQGDVISAADFGKLSWNTAHNNGGNFSFMPLDANQKPILGATAQTVSVYESPAAPDYPGVRNPLTVAHDQTLALGQDLFAGSTASKAPAFIRIESIDAQDGDGTGAALQREADGGTPTTVQQGDVISAADFGKLSWNTAHNDGGSFRFVALDANRKPILGADAQTVTVHESPKAPDYSSQALQVVAHDQVRQIDASIFEGNDPARKPAFVTINQISPEKGANPAPLYIQREGGVKEAVQAGGTIRAEDFGKVHWDTSTNDGGRFTFTAYDAEQYAIEGSAPRTVTVHESPLPPVWNAISLQQQTTYAAHDGSGAFNSGMAYNGYNTPANQRPAAIRITHIDEKNPSATEHSALYSWDGAHRTPLSVGSEVKFGRYSNIRWDTAHNEGGTFRFVALDKDGIEIAGSAEQTMTVIESAAAPVYAAHMPSVFTPYNRPLTLDRTLLAGTDPSREPTAIQITTIYEKDDTAPGTSALAIDRGHGQLDPVSIGSRIPASDLDKLVWRSDANSGGSFTFSMIGADGKPILTTNPASPGSTSTLTRTISVEEGVQGPAYAQNASTLRAAFQQVLEIGKNHLDEIRGTEDSRAPARIEITRIEQPNDRDTSHSPLQLANGTDGSGARQITEGETIDAAEFARLTWDASKTDGGRFIFKPLDKNGRPFVDDSGREVVRTITIDEQPQAAGTPTKPVVAPNAITGLDKSALTSNSPDTSLDGRFFKILSIEAYESPNAKRVMNWELSGRPLPDGGQSGPTAYEIIQADGISLADAQQRAQDMGGKLLSIDDAQERGFIKTSLFNSGPDISTRYHYINQGNVAHDAGSGAKGFIIEYDNYRQPLKLESEHDPNFSGQVEEGQIIVGSELNQAHLGWDSSKNHGGVITLVEVRGQEVEDGSGKNPSLPGNLTKLGHLARDARDPDIGHERFTITISEAEDGSTTFGKPAVSGRSAGTSGHREAADTLDAAELLPGTPSAGSDTATRALPSTLGNLWHGTDPLLHDPLGQHPPLA